MKRWLALSALLVSCACLLPPGAAAFAGVDRSFGDEGVIDVSPELSGYLYESVGEIGIGPGGGIFLLDEGSNCGQFCGTDVYVSRRRPNGGRDLSFGNDGTVAVFRGVAGPISMAVDASGRTVVAAGSSGGISLVRLKPDGRRDGSFGSAGRVTIPCACERNLELMTDPRGRIVVVGERSELTAEAPPTGFSGQAVLVDFRLLPDGRVDRGFGSLGTATATFRDSLLLDLHAVRANGAIVGAAQFCCARPFHAYLTRVSPSGVVDLAFTANSSSSLAALEAEQGLGLSFPWRLLSRPHGELDMLGTLDMLGALGPVDTGFVARFLADGRLDPDFGRGGIRFTPWSIFAAAKDSNGRVFAIGEELLEGTVGFWLEADGRLDKDVAGGRGIHIGRLLGGSIGSTIAMQRGRRPIVFQPTTEACRGYCPPHPKLIRFTAARHGSH